jgi:hypothetical protein
LIEILVVTHPTFVEVNHFTASRSAVGDDGIVIQPQRSLEVVDRDERIGTLLTWSGFGKIQPGHLASDKQRCS